MSRLVELLQDNRTTIQDIEQYLDGLDGETRVAESRAVGPAEQRRLWRLARGRKVTLDDIVPADRGPLESVRHYGRNTLPLFRIFEKRFCRPSDGQIEMLWGYNEGVARAAVGPGYFVTRLTEGDSRGDVVIDYYQVPSEKPDAWPSIVSNDGFPSKLVYGQMHDYLRRVSRHVTIGRAYKKDRETPNCFTLCREA